MIWMYERGAEVLRIETRFDAAASLFELIWHRPDGTNQVEKFSTESAYRVRLESVEEKLRTERWQQAGSPQILRDGWKGL
jgi:hypothetical protein